MLLTAPNHVTISARLFGSCCIREIDQLNALLPAKTDGVVAKAKLIFLIYAIIAADHASAIILITELSCCFNYIYVIFIKKRKARICTFLP